MPLVAGSAEELRSHVGVLLPPTRRAAAAGEEVHGNLHQSCACTRRGPRCRRARTTPGARTTLMKVTVGFSSSSSASSGRQQHPRRVAVTLPPIQLPVASIQGRHSRLLLLQRAKTLSHWLTKYMGTVLNLHCRSSRQQVQK